MTWLAVKAKAAELAQVGDIAAIGAANEPPVDASSLWGGLPFLKPVIDVVKSGVAQWVSVESWPPAIATSLIDALGNVTQLDGFQAIHIRMPSHQRRDKLLQSFLSKVNTPFLVSVQLILKAWLALAKVRDWRLSLLSVQWLNHW